MNTPPNTTNNPASASDNDDMRDEYDIDYTKAQPNRFAAHIKPGGRLIVLEPDVAQAFTTAESVNAVLRAILKALPPQSLAETAAQSQRS
jgi:hypothetical protein